MKNNHQFIVFALKSWIIDAIRYDKVDETQ